MLNALARNFVDFLRTLATAEPMMDWRLKKFKYKLFKIRAKVGAHDRYIAFQKAQVAGSKVLCCDILQMIGELPPTKVASTASRDWLSRFRSKRWEGCAQMIKNGTLSAAWPGVI